MVGLRLGLGSEYEFIKDGDGVPIVDELSER